MTDHIKYIDHIIDANFPKGYRAWTVEYPNGATLWSFEAEDGGIVEGIPNTIELMERVWEDVSITEFMKSEG